MRAALKDVDKVVYQRAEINDAPAILGLQKIAYRSEAEIYGEDNLPAMQQTLEELQKDFARPEQVFLKAVVNGKIIGSVRGFPSDQATLVSRLIVHPFFQRHGIGQKLIEEIEKAFPASKRFEVFTGQRSEDNLRRLRKLGFQEFKTEPFKPALTWVHLQKERS
ncbi:MAG: GNAT family N-acetyltransferase [Opitutaceae bacterium]